LAGLRVPSFHENARVSRKRVARLMRNAGLVGVSRRKSTVKIVRDRGRQAPDLVDRDFTADQPNKLWVADGSGDPWTTGADDERSAIGGGSLA